MPAHGSREPGSDGHPREVYLYHVVDNAETWGRDQAQAVVWQTAINPVVALELLAAGTWAGAGVLGPEADPPDPFLDLLTAYGSPWRIRSARRRRRKPQVGPRTGRSRSWRAPATRDNHDHNETDARLQDAPEPDAAVPEPAAVADSIEAGSLLEATPECLVVAADDGRIVYANRNAETLTGFTRHELVGKHIEMLVEPTSWRRATSRASTRCAGPRTVPRFPVEVHVGVLEHPTRLLVVTLSGLDGAPARSRVAVRGGGEGGRTSWSTSRPSSTSTPSTRTRRDT